MTVLTEDIKNMPYQIITQSHEMSCVQRKDKKNKHLITRPQLMAVHSTANIDQTFKVYLYIHLSVSIQKR